jgi:hypothetical protein
MIAMAAHKRFRPEKDPILQRARRVIARARREIEKMTARDPSRRGESGSATTHERRRLIIGLIADLDLAIKAMRARRDEIGEQAGIVFHRRQVISAYHRVSLLKLPLKSICR